MKIMVQKAGIENDRLRNHSGRKTMIQMLSEHDIPPTEIAQLSGHKNLKSIENYSTVSTQQQMHISKVLSSVMAGTAASSSSETACTPSPTLRMVVSSSPWHYSVAQLFKVAISPSTLILSLNQSPTLSTNPSSPEAVRWKRLRPLELESDSDDE